MDNRLYTRLANDKTSTNEVEHWAFQHVRKKTQNEGCMLRKQTCYMESKVVTRQAKIKIIETKKSLKMLRRKLRSEVKEMEESVTKSEYYKESMIQYTKIMNTGSG